MLLEGGLFFAIAVCAAGELFRSRRQKLFTFRIERDDGPTVAFVTTDADDALRLKTALDAAIAH